ncbi:MAG: hypothetical protein FWC03_11945 [Treponema sp.]|nr:hypothetical protein [Treponema sp.]
MSAKICKITIIMVIAALTAGCPGYNELNTHLQDSENGFLTINIGDSNENRTILPKNANINCNTFSLVLTALGKRVERDWTGGAVSIELSPGSWDLTLTGYSDAQRQTPLVYGSANGIVVGQSQTTSHTVYLQPAMVFDRTGTFIWNINYPADVTSASMVITPLNTSNGSPQQTVNFSSGALKNNSSSTLTLNTGYYKVTFSMTGGERPLGRVDYMHIYEGLESYFSYNFVYGSQNLSKRYEVVNQTMTWENAKLEAERRGGYLAVITSAEEQSTIESLISRDGSLSTYWLGGYRDANNQFVWVTGEPMNFSNWGTGEPNNSGGRENWIEINRSNGKWNDMYQTNRGFIIEWDIMSTSPSSGKRYEVVNQSMNWENAKLEAERRGGYLAVITSAQEQSTIESLVSRDGTMECYWLGGYRNTNNTFVWITGEPMSYTNWYPGEPNNTYGTEDKMEYMQHHSGRWNDNSSQANGGFIIEWD